MLALSQTLIASKKKFGLASKKRHAIGTNKQFTSILLTNRKTMQSKTKQTLREKLQMLEKNQLLDICCKLLEESDDAIAKLESMLPNCDAKEIALTNSKVANNTTTITTTLQNEDVDNSNYPENQLHQLELKAKCNYLHSVVFTEKKRYKQHTTDIDSFCNEFVIVGVSVDSLKPMYYNYNYKKEHAASIVSSWQSDPWFLHLQQMQINYTEREAPSLPPHSIVGVFHMQNITYCLLIRYVDSTSQITRYQIYLGKDCTMKRWNRSGENHFAHVRDILIAKPNSSHYGCDLALTYFGPQNAILFTVGHSNEEGTLSEQFPMPQSAAPANLAKHNVSLSPIKGNKKK